MICFVGVPLPPGAPPGAAGPTPPIGGAAGSTPPIGDSPQDKLNLFLGQREDPEASAAASDAGRVSQAFLQNAVRE